MAFIVRTAGVHMALGGQTTYQLSRFVPSPVHTIPLPRVKLASPVIFFTITIIVVLPCIILGLPYIILVLPCITSQLDRQEGHMRCNITSCCYNATTIHLYQHIYLRHHSSHVMSGGHSDALHDDTC